MKLCDYEICLNLVIIFKNGAKTLAIVKNILNYSKRVPILWWVIVKYTSLVDNCACDLDQFLL